MNNWKAENAYNKKLGSIFPPSYPNEMLVKICSSKKYSDISKRLFLKKKIKVCELGCLSGNNIRFFLDKGWKVYGVEINKELKELSRKNLSRMKIKFSNVKIGHNEKIPYKSNFFDLLVSINTIHYSYGNKLNKALFEVSRVLNKDGLAIIETPSNKHDAIKNSIKKSENHWIWKWGGFRQNSIMGFFDNKAKLKRKLKNFFSEVEINERSEIYKNIKLYWFVAICKK